MKKLTVIIPFLNEGAEVYNTVRNILETSNNEVNIILINDASYDNYNYESIAKKYKLQYIEHGERIGVAASRDEAIDLCKTDYFILLDAHMRAFEKGWHIVIVEEMAKDERVLLCCKTIPLDINGEISQKNKFEGYAAYIKPDLSVEWIFCDIWPNKNIIDIPCVLGASYACEKTYWQYLRGLSGLKSYGMDEQMISLKVWLEGGRCRLLKDLSFGHIFRSSETVPYKIDSIDFLYNKLYIIELLIGEQNHKFALLEHLKKEYGKELFSATMDRLLSNKEDIIKQRIYFEKIFQRDFKYFLDFNEKMKKKFTEK